MGQRLTKDPKCRNHDTECWQLDSNFSCGDGRNQDTARDQQEENRIMNVDRPIGSEHVAAWTTKVVWASCPTIGWHDYRED